MFKKQEIADTVHDKRFFSPHVPLLWMNVYTKEDRITIRLGCTVCLHSLAQCSNVWSGGFLSRRYLVQSALFSDLPFGMSSITDKRKNSDLCIKNVFDVVMDLLLFWVR